MKQYLYREMGSYNYKSNLILEDMCGVEIISFLKEKISFFKSKTILINHLTGKETEHKIGEVFVSKGENFSFSVDGNDFFAKAKEKGYSYNFTGELKSAGATIYKNDVLVADIKIGNTGTGEIPLLSKRMFTLTLYDDNEDIETMFLFTFLTSLVQLAL